MSARLAALALACLVSVAASTVSASPIQWTSLHEPGAGGFLTAVQVSPHDTSRAFLAGDMLGLGRSEDGGSTWLPSFAPAYEVADFSFHPTNPSVVWAGSMSGPLLSTDGGHTYTLRRGGEFPPISGGHYSAPVEVVRFDPLAPGRLLAFGGSARHWSSPGEPLWGAVWESLDGGGTWKRLTTLDQDGSRPATDLRPGRNITSAWFAGGSEGRRLYAAAGGAVLRSDDSGATWKRASEGLPALVANRLAVHPTDPDTLFVSLERHQGPDGSPRPGGIYKSTDGARSWKEASAGLSRHTHPSNHHFTASYNLLLLAPSEPELLYTSDNAWNTGVVYRSTDGAQTWQPVATRGNQGQDDNDPLRKQFASVFRPEVGMFAGLGMSLGGINPTNADIAFVANSETVLRTTDRGATWQDVTAHRPDPQGKLDAWRGTGYTGWCATDIAFAPERAGESALLAMDAAKAWRSTDDLQSWTYHGQAPWPWGGGIQGVFAGPWLYFTSGQHGTDQGIYRTERATGATKIFQGAAHGLPAMPGHARLGGIYAHPSAPDTVWAAVEGDLRRSTDAGQSWTTVLPGKDARWVVGDPREPRRIYVNGRDGVWQAEDGETFRLIGGPKPANRGRLRVAADGTLYAAHHREARPGLWRYADGKWLRLLDDNHAADVAIEGDRLALVTTDDPYHDLTHATGVWISADAGRTWSTANTGLPLLRGMTIAFDPHHPGRLLVGTFGRGFYRADWPADHAPRGTRTYAGVAGDGDDEAFATPEDDRELVPGLPPLRNGSMTRGGRDAVHWTRTWSGAGRFALERDTATFASAPASLSLRSVEGPTNVQVMQLAPARAGQLFEVSGRLKTEGTAKVSAALQYYRGGMPFEFVQLRFAQSTVDWDFFAKTVKLPDGIEEIAFVLLLEGDGRAWLDDLAVNKVE